MRRCRRSRSRTVDRFHLCFALARHWRTRVLRRVLQYYEHGKHAETGNQPLQPQIIENNTAKQIASVRRILCHAVPWGRPDPTPSIRRPPRSRARRCRQIRPHTPGRSTHDCPNIQRSSPPFVAVTRSGNPRYPAPHGADCRRGPATGRAQPGRRTAAPYRQTVFIDKIRKLQAPRTDPPILPNARSSTRGASRSHVASATETTFAKGRSSPTALMTSRATTGPTGT